MQPRRNQEADAAAAVATSAAGCFQVHNRKQASASAGNANDVQFRDYKAVELCNDQRPQTGVHALLYDCLV